MKRNVTILLFFLAVVFTLQGQKVIFQAQPLKERLEGIIARTGITIAYSAEQVKDFHVPKLEIESNNVAGMLSKSLQNTNLGYKMTSDRAVTLYRKSAPKTVIVTTTDTVYKPASPKPTKKYGTLSGRVMDEDGESVIGAAVRVQGTQAAAMTDGVSADLIKKTSDSNVAQVLKRVSGVTIDAGKYVTVRGMSERYNNVQLNGANLPSTEPNRRNFSFDVIPTGLVDNVTIAKTFTPDLPGEFTGGLVEVNTLAVPDRKFLNISAGTGGNSISTGKEFLSNTRFKSDWLFGEVKKRQWFVGPSYFYSEENRYNAGMKNTFGFKVFKTMPTQSYSITGGLPIDLGSAGRLGVVAALTYRHEEKREEILEGMKVNRDYISRPGMKFTLSTAAGAVANIGWQLGGHKITWRNLYNNRFTHSNQHRHVYDDYDGKEYYEQYSRPLVSSLRQTQMDGEHKLFGSNLILSWNGSVNAITRTNPDDRLAVNYVIGKKLDGTGDAMLVSGSGNRLTLSYGHVMYSRLDESKKNFAVNAEHPFTVAGNRQSIKAGYHGTLRNARFAQQYLTHWSKLGERDRRGESIADNFDPKDFEDGSHYYRLSGISGLADEYRGEQIIHAGYLMGEFSFFKKLRLIAGVRAESTDMKTTTTLLIQEYRKEGDIFSEQDSIVSLKRTDLLPAATLIYSPLPDLNIRAAYSKTLARPDFRELSLSQYYNVDERVAVMSRPLELSFVHNWDARAEWYPRPGEVLSVGYFYKKFIKPVEMVMRMRSDHQNFDMFNINLDQSIAQGVELNWRKSLGFIVPALSSLYLTGNYTWMDANVEYNNQVMYWDYMSEEAKEAALKNKDNHRVRPLQGLSPYAVNLGLAYEGKRMGAAVHYNRNGRTLVIAGEFKYADEYEAPRDVLDLQLSARFLKERLEVKLSASDILHQDVLVYKNQGVFYQGVDDKDTFVRDRTDDMRYNEGDWVVSRVQKGVNFSVSAAWKF